MEKDPDHEPDGRSHIERLTRIIGQLTLLVGALIALLSQISAVREPAREAYCSMFNCTTLSSTADSKSSETAVSDETVVREAESEPEIATEEEPEIQSPPEPEIEPEIQSPK